MTFTTDATYEGGVLKPAEPLPLAEHAQVRVTVVEQHQRCAEEDRLLADGPPVWEQILAITRTLPPEEFDGLPADGASQHDHYIYGTPKRTDLRDSPE